MKTNQAIATPEPDLPNLINDLQDILVDASDTIGAREAYDDVRYARWSGQSDDGRKHESDLGFVPGPWEGASDSRIRLADRIINEHVALVTEAFFRAQLQVVGVEKNDMTAAGTWSDLMNWLIHQKLEPELRQQVEILANHVFSDHPAVGILGIYWKQEVQMNHKTFGLEDLAKIIMGQGGDENALVEIVQKMEDPQFRPQIMELVRGAFPGVEDKELEKALDDFIENQEATVSTPQIKENRPYFVAHKLFDDIFLPANTYDIQECGSVYRRQWMSEVAIREKIVSEDWPEEFVEELLKHEGTSNVETSTFVETTGVGLESLNRGNRGSHDGMYEVWYSYQRQSTDDDVPGIYCTIFSPFVRDLYAKHELLAYQHGEMPFVLFARERLGQSIFDSRSISEICMTYQTEVKIQRDCRTDATTISTLPPLQVHARRGGLNLLMAPGAQISVQRADDLNWLNPPPMPQGSIEIEQRCIDDVEQYFGGGGDIQRKLLYQQNVVNRWLASWRQAYNQCMQLIQQYWDTATISRVTNGKPETMMISSDDIQGQYDMSLRFSADNLDPEFTQKKLEAIAKLVVPLDVTGVIDRSALVKLVLEMLSPQMAQELVMDDKHAALKEVDAEQNAWVKILAGIEPAMSEDVNFPLRVQTAQQVMQSSQELQQKMQQQPLVQQLAQNRLKYLQFGMQQKQNAATGRLGTSPVGPPDGAQAGPPPGPGGPEQGPPPGPQQGPPPGPQQQPEMAY
jgi:hypothetical protein